MGVLILVRVLIVLVYVILSKKTVHLYHLVCDNIWHLASSSKVLPTIVSHQALGRVLVVVEVVLCIGVG